MSEDRRPAPGTPPGHEWRPRPTSPSPPTDRVIAVLELLAASKAALTVAEVAARLDLNRSTATVVLAALEHPGWVRRLPDRRYRLGGGLLGVAEAVYAAVPALDQVRDHLRTVSAEAGCGSALASVSPRHLVFLAVEPGPGRLPPGVTVGTRLPLRPPVGAAAVAWWPRTEGHAWLNAAPQADRGPLRTLLALVRERGTATWMPASGHDRLLEVLHEVVTLLDEHPARAELRTRVLDQLGRLGACAHTASDLDAPGVRPVSYLSAPVLDADGRARHEVQIGPMRAAVPRAERRRYATLLQSAANRLAACLGEPAAAPDTAGSAAAGADTAGSEPRR